MRSCLPLLRLCPQMLWAEPSGPIEVVDGDTLHVGGVTVRLFGIDAPERDQTCDRGGVDWACGEWAADAVARDYAGVAADCEAVDLDRYGRVVARCWVEGQDIGRALVAAGVATAYRDYSWDYDLEEKGAQLAGLGIWAGDLMDPAAFRATQAPPPQAAPGDCVIKGNISANGQIYHVPGQENYADTQINLARGERWFCSAAEAEAAGWRPARR
jgi:endonuclease YncB( thermonuclease family)